MFSTNYVTIAWLLPEMVLVLLASWVLVGSSITRSRVGWTVFALATLAVAAYALARQTTVLWEALGGGSAGMSGPLAMDFLGILGRWLGLAIGAVLVLASVRPGDDELSGENLGLLMFVAAGVMLVSSAGELVLLFLGLELISIPTYALLFLGRRDRETGEATAKYFFLSVLSSAVFLYGISFLYGAAGNTHLSAIHGALEMASQGITQPNGPPGGVANFAAPLAVALIVAGLGFKITAVPFHFYAPDVYQGATHLNAGVLSVAPKIAGFIALVRLLVFSMPGQEEFGWQLAVTLALVTMTLGNVCALWQNHIRRLMAYSAVAHTGYLMVGLAVALAAGPSSGGLPALLFYLGAYAFASLGIFCSLASLRRGSREVTGVSEMAGLARSQPVAAACLAICCFSLAGIPPLAGFWGKFGLFLGALDVGSAAVGTGQGAWFMALAVVGMVNAAVAAAYYLRIVAALYFRPSVGEPVVVAAPCGLASGIICTALVVLAGLAPHWPLQAVRLAEHASPNAIVEKAPLHSTKAERELQLDARADQTASAR